ncbi:MAG: class I SAM-dependent methyltransferase [Acidobacteria bacterium]|nr:MAG: class I SAM-dependent methyltransferase [Acidobacteriota bacterium]
MTTPFTYQFGYSWPVAWGHLVPFVLFGGLAVLGIRRGWRRWLVSASWLLAVWAAAGLLITHFMFRINLPQPLATEQFLASGSGRVVDVGAGSGRATVGLLLARPRITVTALDIYDGYYGIDDNTPERLMENARIAGVAERAEAKVGDARQLPFASETYDGVISVAAIDHLPRAGIPKALAEAARVVKPGGEFLLTIVNADAWAWLASPHAIAHHRPPDRAQWRGLLQASGFEVVEEGTMPGALYFFSRKHP